MWVCEVGVCCVGVKVCESVPEGGQWVREVSGTLLKQFMGR